MEESIMTKPDRPCLHYTELTELAPDDPQYREYHTYLREQPRLLAEGHEGKHALIKGDTILGLFDSRSNAYEEMSRNHYQQGCLIQQILEWHILYRMPWCA